MQNSERQKFEESWKDAFNGAESTPPDNVWNSIELDLAGQESIAMKRKVVFYQRLAAAMLVFGLIAGSYGYYASIRSNDVQREMSNVQRATDNVNGETRNVQRATNDVKGEMRSGKRSAGDDGGTVQSVDPVVAMADKNEERNEGTKQGGQLAFTDTEPAQHTEVTQPVEITRTDPIAIAKEETKAEEKSEEELVTSLRQQLEGPETIVEPKDQKRQGERLWLALGGSAGNYTPNTATATTPTASQSSFDAKGPALSFSTTSAPKPQPKVGSSYSVGVGVGKKFGRFVVQTGVNLNKQQINYISNYDAHTASNTSVATMADYVGQYSSGLTVTNEYTVSSTMDIVSIPVQLGYMIIDRRLGWQLNGGVSNDFFLRNVLVDKSGQRSKFSQEAGSESPYRSVNWSALASTELSYRIGRHYRVSLVPGARYSFNSILKDTKDNGRPIVLDVGFRFRYIFD